MSKIEFDDWSKLDLRVGKIEEVEEIPGADKLYKLTVNIGSEKRTVCAGIKKYYTPKQLNGKLCVLFANLQPRMMKGVESQGMILAAVNEDESKIILITSKFDTNEGIKVEFKNG